MEIVCFEMSTACMIGVKQSDICVWVSFAEMKWLWEEAGILPGTFMETELSNYLQERFNNS